MLKDIRIHLDPDEAQQSKNDAYLAEHVSRYRNENINAMQRFLPSLLPYIQQHQLLSFGLFCNKFNEYNIVDYGLGRTFYGLHPRQEIEKQQFEFWQSPVVIQTGKEKQSTDGVVNSPTPSLAGRSTGELLVIMGLGLGYHVLDAVVNQRAKHIIVYEPEIQFFLCSTSIIDWKTLLAEAKKNNIGLYFQLQKDGRDILADIAQFQEHYSLETFSLFKHYNHPIFDTVCEQLENRAWSELNEHGLRFSNQQDGRQYNSPWAPRVAESNIKLSKTTLERFDKNLEAFKNYFPSIYREFVDYHPVHWAVIENSEGEINLVRDFDTSPFHVEHPKLEGEISYLNFSHHPNKDGLVLGYKGNKLKDYTHYRFVNKAEKYLDQLDEQQGALPDNIKSLILFGLGTGYHLAELTEHHNVEMLFVCEPNRDYFYGSLYAIDWSSILQKIDEADGRIYLNVGDNTAQLFNDLLGQFYSIGPHVLSNTYFYQGYYNEYLVELIAQLREQLKIVISYGEYFDHARYGIAQTKYGVTSGIGHMVASPEKIVSEELKELPVFLVGNGPSLDKAFDAIKEYQDQAIIVSCGTALQSLYKKGITPDFHAEVEQNRATFDWVSRIGDFDYLKNITLVSCNGIHPDTCELFKDTLIAFKEGESSTVSILNILGADKHQILQFAFPTVANFAFNFFSAAGMQQIYLFGVDLGFHDAGNHHSKLSGYYDKDGKELSNFLEKMNTSIRVPGNFSKTVFTKHEFKVSKNILEQALAKTSCSVYNTSDGAKIEGSVPLHLEHILVTSTADDKRTFLKRWPEKCFVRYNNTDFENRFSKRYNQTVLTEQLDELLIAIEQAKQGELSAEGLISKQTKLLHTAIKRNDSLFFFYLQGTTMFANVVLSRIALNESTEVVQQVRHDFLSDWEQTVLTIQKELVLFGEEFDVSSSFTTLRKRIYLRDKISVMKLLIVGERSSVIPFVNYFLTEFDFDISFEIVSGEEFKSVNKNEFNFILYTDDARQSIKEAPDLLTYLESLPHKVMVVSSSPVNFYRDLKIPLNVSIFLSPGNFKYDDAPIECSAPYRLLIPIMLFQDTTSIDFLAQKYSIVGPMTKLPEVDYDTSLNCYCTSNVIIMTRRGLTSKKMILSDGTRLKRLANPLQRRDFIAVNITPERELEIKLKLSNLLERGTYV